MRKSHVLAALLSALFLCCLCPQALAAPAADLSMRITDRQQVGDAVEFSAVIDIGKPTEPYASLDFSIVSSNEESLHIVDLSENGDKSNLAFEFSPDYGGVYHKGRINEEDGSVSYLVGLFSQETGNNITDETNICTVRFRYTGDAEEELSLEGLKLVYKNPQGEITGAASEVVVSQPILYDRFERVSVSEIPLGSAEPGEKAPPTAFILGTVAVVLIASAIIVLRLRAKKTAARHLPRR